MHAAQLQSHVGNAMVSEGRHAPHPYVPRVHTHAVGIINPLQRGCKIVDLSTIRYPAPHAPPCQLAHHALAVL